MHTILTFPNTVTAKQICQYLTETTLLGWSARDIISWPVTKFQTLHVRSETKMEEEKRRTETKGDFRVNIFILFVFIFTFWPCKEEVICGIHTENRFGVALSYMDTLNFGPPTVLRTRHGVDHTSAVHMKQGWHFILVLCHVLEGGVSWSGFLHITCSFHIFQQNINKI